MNPFDWIKHHFQGYWMDWDNKPKKRDKQIVHRRGRRRNKQDLRKELKEFDK